MSLPTFWNTPAFVFCPSAPLAMSAFEPRRRLIVGVPRIVGQRLVHGPDDVRQRVEADDVGGAIGRALRAPDQRAGQCIDHVEAQAEALGVRHRRQHREHADAIGDEVGRVLGAHHALAERGDQEGFELIEQRRRGILLRDQLDQMHVARRVEEMDAAKARPQRRGTGFGERVDRQARGIAGEDRLCPDVRRHLFVQRLLPVHALGDRLDHQVAARKQRAGAGRSWPGRCSRRDPWSPAATARACLRLSIAFCAMPFGSPSLAARSNSSDRNAGIGEMRGDLRAHDAGAEHGDLAHEEMGFGHGGLPG